MAATTLMDEDCGTSDSSTLFQIEEIEGTHLTNDVMEDVTDPIEIDDGEDSTCSKTSESSIRASTSSCTFSLLKKDKDVDVLSQSEQNYEADPAESFQSAAETNNEEILERNEVEDISTDEAPVFRCCNCISNPLCRRAFKFWKHWANIIIDSIYLIPLHILLLLLPIPAGFMGCQYIKDCPMDPSIPTLFIGMGFLGTVGLLSRTVFILYKKYWTVEDGDDWDMQRKLIYYCNVLFFLIFSIEWSRLLRSTPNFQTYNGSYCDPTFYTYAYWMN